MHGETPNLAARWGETPGAGSLRVEQVAGDVETASRVERHRRQFGGAEPGHAVIVTAEILAIETDAMDHPGIEVRHEQLLVRGIVGEVAEAGPRIGHAVEGDIGQQADGAGAAIHLVDAPGSALQVEPELSLHPSGARAALLPALGLAVASAHHDVEAEDRGGGEIDVGSGVIVERDTEDLADVLGEDIERLGSLEQSTVPDKSRLADADDAGGRTFRVDEGEIDCGFVRRTRLRRIGRRGAGKSGDDRVTQIQARRTIALLRLGVAGMKQEDEQQQRQKPCDNPGQASPPIAGP